MNGSQIGYRKVQNDPKQRREQVLISVARKYVLGCETESNELRLR
jgi:hypothetical protein